MLKFPKNADELRSIPLPSGYEMKPEGVFAGADFICSPLVLLGHFPVEEDGWCMALAVLDPGGFIASENIPWRWLAEPSKIQRALLHRGVRLNARGLTKLLRAMLQQKGETACC